MPRARTIAERQKNNRLYRIWKGIRQRCYNRKTPGFKNYGGREIVMCNEWWESFSAFESWALTSGYSPELTIDRYPDNNGNYEPTNCRWATRGEQSRNTRRTLIVAAFGCLLPLKDWAADCRCKVSYETLLYRFNAGWPIESAMSTPTNGSKRLPLLLTAFGETKSAKDWSRDARCAVTYRALVKRIRKGVPAETAICTPSWNESHFSRCSLVTT